MFSSRVPRSLRARRALLGLAATTLAVSAAPASAASVSLKITDPASDGNGGAGLEITGATLSQDTGTGNVTATVSLGAAPPATATFAVGLGKMSNGVCSVGQAGDGSLAIFGNLESPPRGVWATEGDTAVNNATVSLSGTTLKLATGASSSLKKLAWNCGTVSLQTTNDAGDAIGDSAAGSGTSAGASQVVVLTDKPDGDQDGIPDVADACPAVAGSSANGCLEMPANLALRLGAKKIAVDTLVPRTGTTCASVAKATVKAGGKTIGKGTLSVGVHGSFCHISGSVKIKKHGKKVKLTIAGSGFATISAALKK